MCVSKIIIHNTNTINNNNNSIYLYTPFQSCTLFLGIYRHVASTTNVDIVIKHIEH